jgi:integrative and conjugative element protein (TIGR02256 family)
MAVCIADFECEYGGETIRLKAGLDHVAERHELIRRYPDCFAVDTATAGERGEPPIRRARASGVPELRELRYVRRLDVELDKWTYRTIDNADGLFDGRETGGALFGFRTPQGFRVTDASGPGWSAEREPNRMLVDWDHVDQAEEAQQHTGAVTVGHWHTHPNGNTEPSETDRQTWADSLAHVEADAYVGVIVTERPGIPSMRFNAWTVSERTAAQSANPQPSQPLKERHMATRKPVELFQCVESFVAAGESETPSYARGLRLAADHPAVKRYPQYWVSVSTPDDEVRKARGRIYEAAGAPAPR